MAGERITATLSTIISGSSNTSDNMASEQMIANDMNRQLVLAQPRHSFPFTNDELRERVTKAIANRTFDSSLKLRPLLPKQIDAAPLIQNIQLPSIKSFFNEVLQPITRSASVPGLILDGLPLKIFKICGKQYMMQISQNQSDVETMTRVTQDGRELTYRLEMCQQPRQARACGNGARCKC